jgi:ArsR family transcriptional regulator, arsenate/arsenite/antimonite-responsive transcriptional repressor
VETNQAVQALSALAQDTRLGIYRLLVQAGPQGLAAGAIGDKLDLAPATLSFHLAGLARAGLAQGRQEGRFVIYTANFENMNALVAFLTENCCSGTACAPTACPPSNPTVKGKTDETLPRARRRA